MVMGVFHNKHDKQTVGFIKQVGAGPPLPALFRAPLGSLAGYIWQLQQYLFYEGGFSPLFQKPPQYFH